MLHDHQTSVRPKTQHEIDNIFYSVTLLRVSFISSCYYEGVGRGFDGWYHLFLWIPPSIVVYRSREYNLQLCPVM